MFTKHVHIKLYLHLRTWIKIPKLIKPIKQKKLQELIEPKEKT